MNATTAAPLDRRLFTRDLWRAVAHPLRAWEGMTRWAVLARAAELPYAEVARFRRELIDDQPFQRDVGRRANEVGYYTCGPQLYALVRATRPDVIVETGVASGVSSAHMLRALQRNGSGTLHSIDLANVQEGSELPVGQQTGWIVPDSLRSRWHLQLGDSRELLPGLLDTLERIDFFFHDSDHSYAGMSFEFEQALPKLAENGLLVSDDTYLHTAWDDFCARHGLRATRAAHVGVTRNRSRR